MKAPAGAADARRRAPLPHRGPRSVRPTATVASKGLPRHHIRIATLQPVYIRCRVAACRGACGAQHRARWPPARNIAVHTAHRPWTQRAASSTPCAACQVYGSCNLCTLHDRCRWFAGALAALAREIVLVAQSAGNSADAAAAAKSAPLTPRLRQPRRAFSASRCDVRAARFQRRLDGPVLRRAMHARVAQA